MSGLPDPFAPSRVALTTLLTLAVLAGTSGWVARDHRTVLSDLPQDYSSARAWLDGDSPYRPLGELLVRYGFPPPSADVLVGTNPHPPVAVLLTVPYVGAEFETALAWVRWTLLAELGLSWEVGCGVFRAEVEGWAGAVC